MSHGDKLPHFTCISTCMVQRDTTITVRYIVHTVTIFPHILTDILDKGSLQKKSVNNFTPPLDPPSSEKFWQRIGIPHFHQKTSVS